jgi:methyl-accepting chemotaxis protein
MDKNISNSTQQEQCPDAVRLEKVTRVVADAANQATLLSVNTAIIAEKLETKEGINVIAKELQALAEQLKLAAEELANIVKNQ